MTRSRGDRRPYRLNVRAQRQAETRRKITAAAIRLHEEIGPLRTSVAEVARQAGVERPTVYRHFADDVALLRACQAEWLTTHPPPDMAAWAAIADPAERLRSGLQELYAFYRGGARMIDNLFRDAPRYPALREVLAVIFSGLEAAADLLTGGLAVAPPRRRLVRAAVGHAIAFETWRSLVLVGKLSDDEAAALMAKLAIAAAGSEP